MVSCRLGPGQDIRLRSVSRPEKHLAILFERLGLPLPNKPKETEKEEWCFFSGWEPRTPK